MTAMNWLRGGWLLAAVGVGLLSAGAAVAEVPIYRPGSILMFPKVVRNSARTTAIEISSTSNMLESVRCYYLNENCNEVDFELLLTRQQPTYWRVDTGRTFNTSGGLLPGLIPPVPDGFQGALICASVDPTSDATELVATNKLKGKATIEDTGSGNESSYNAIPVLGHEEASGGNVAELNGEITGYEECPSILHIDTFAPPPATDPVIGENGTVCTGLTLLSCNLDLEQASGGSFALQYMTWNEFEQPISNNDSGRCVYFANLCDVLSPINPVTPYNAVSITATGSPVVGVAEYFHVDTTPPAPQAASAARTVHDVSSSYQSSSIRFPAH